MLRYENAELEQELFFMAFRYALPRHTYCCDDVARHIVANAAQFSEHTRALIIKELGLALDGKDPYITISQIDRPSWERALAALRAAQGDTK